MCYCELKLKEESYDHLFEGEAEYCNTYNVLDDQSIFLQTQPWTRG